MRRLVVSTLIAVLGLPVLATQASARTDGSTPAPKAIAQLVTHVPAATLNQVGAGQLSGPQLFNVFNLHGSLRSHGKPELLTMNLAWCPHCAANNWALAVALSRFGTLSGLRVINSGTYYCTVTHDPCTLSSSGSFPCYPNTHGLSFFNAGFKSPYLALQPLVLQDVKGRNLERPTRKEIAAIQPFDNFGGTPAVDVGGQWGFLNSGFDPGLLAHKSWSQIAGSLSDPHARVAKHIDGLANLFTAAICRVTKGRPARVCKSAGVLAAGAARLH